LHARLVLCPGGWAEHKVPGRDPVTPEVDAAMGRALELAAAAVEWGDTPIGAVVLGPDGAVLAEAANEREKFGDPTAHA
jgi:tRNA(adenine34) deaminase